ncbi:hypothetical protein ACFLTB_04500 [Chloroflexota bacterium]
MSNSGIVLEARAQRLFFAQGIFAERSLLPSADPNHQLLATDIDVLASEYSSGFHLTRRNIECKSGKNVAILDRVLWLKGVKEMLNSDASYLIINNFNEGASDFARNLGIDIMTTKQLESWEKSLKIPNHLWPNRSNYLKLDNLKRYWLDEGKQGTATDLAKLNRRIIQFIEIDSWRVFGYSLQNRLFRLFLDLSDISRTFKDTSIPDSMKYCSSALLVRFCQYLLAACHDISRVPVSDLQSYLNNRLTFGDQDPQRARGLISSTVQWVSQNLKKQGIGLPLSLEEERLLQPPAYSDGYIGLVEKLITSPVESRFLPIAMETEQFSSPELIERFPRIRTAWQAGRELTSLVKGFLIASLGINSEILQALPLDKIPDMKRMNKIDKPQENSQQTAMKLDKQ